ncbi:hypothetical protein AB0Q95_29815 [Streptomyces sp. NPDC059900]|uniref:hypothetical protein n=1 Tax=Streptomyces sp. NPDC059900 TaxID=3155816 RepID=UPI003441C0D4
MANKSVGAKAMVDSTGLSVSGWRNREVSLSLADSDRPTVLEFRGGWFTSQYRLQPLETGENEESLGPVLATVMGRESNRFVLNKPYTRFRISRFSTRGNSVTHGPWHLRVVPLDELTPLRTLTQGKHGDLLFHSGRSVTVEFAWHGHAGGALYFQGLADKNEWQLTGHQALRGTTTIPRKGLLRVEGYGRWQLKMKPSGS